MNSRSSEPASAADSEVRLRAALRVTGNGREAKLVAVEIANGQVFEFPYDETLYADWRVWLSNQRHGSSRASKYAEFRERIDTVTEQFAAPLGVAELARLVEAVSPDSSATAFFRIELADWALDAMPWELLAVPVARELGGRRVCVYRAVRARKRSVTPPVPPQSVLLVNSEPLSMQSLSFGPEEREIQRRLGLMKMAGLVQVESCLRTDFDDLGVRMKRPARLVHIAIHGKPGKVYFSHGKEAVQLSGAEFAEMFDREPQPVAVIFSTCDSAQPSLVDLDVTQRTSADVGVARAVAQTGVTDVIGMYSAILPSALLEFFGTLYEALSQCLDMTTAYARAVAALHETDNYPDCGFWSVPVLYSSNNVIPLPAALGDPQGAYQHAAFEVAQLKAELSDLCPDDSWDEYAWQRNTMMLRAHSDSRRDELRRLSTLVDLEMRAGSRWAAEVSYAVDAGLRAFDSLISHANRARSGVRSTESFIDARDEIETVLSDLYDALSARLMFSQ